MPKTSNFKNFQTPISPLNRGNSPLSPFKNRGPQGVIRTGWMGYNLPKEANQKSAMPPSKKNFRTPFWEGCRGTVLFSSQHVLNHLSDCHNARKKVGQSTGLMCQVKNSKFSVWGPGPQLWPPVRPPVSIVNSVGPMGAHATAQIVRVMHMQVPRNLNVLKKFSTAHISKTISDVLWPRYFSGSCVRNLCRVRAWCR